MGVGGRDLAAARQARGPPRAPRPRPSRPSSRSQGDLVELSVELAGRGRRSGAGGGRRSCRASSAGVQRQARVDPAVDLADVGQGRGRLVDQLGRACRRRSRPRARPPGRRWPAGAAQAGEALGRAAEELDELHRREHQRELARRGRTRGRRPTSPRPRSPAAAARALRAATSSGSRSSPMHPVPAPGEVERDPAGAAAEVEDRPAGRAGELAARAPGRRRRRRTRRRARSPPSSICARLTRQNSFARPREDSSLRSSSSAV